METQFKELVSSYLNTHYASRMARAFDVTTVTVFNWATARSIPHPTIQRLVMNWIWTELAKAKENSK